MYQKTSCKFEIKSDDKAIKFAKSKAFLLFPTIGK